MATKTWTSVSAIGHLSLGQNVLFYLGDAKEWVAGIVRFLGTTDFIEGEWIGLELKEAHGKNDGEVKGKRYFTCQPKHGVFTKPGMVRAALAQSRTTTHRKQKRTGRLRPEIVVAEEGPPANQTPPPDLHSEPSQSPGAVQSMPLQAKAKKRELIDLLGGEDEVAKHKKASRDVQQKVNQMLKEGEDPASQPAIFQGIGLQRMLHMAEHFKQEFDKICWELEKRLKDHHDVSYTAAPIKSFASASSKVSTEYHGNCTQLKDVVRGTMVINSTEEHPPSLRDAYDILRKLVAADDILRKVNARFSRFSDRYQKPVGASKYRDWLFLIKVGDFICELQVNFKEAVEVKEAEQHKDYEMERLGTRKLLEASMSNDPSMVQLLLSSGRVHQKTMANTRDCHGYTPLHYAARHGSMAMLEHLLPAGADVLALDREGFPAIHHALQASHPKVTERLLDEMLKLPAAKLRKEPLASRIQGVWGAAHQASNPAMQGLVERFTELAKKCYTVASVHLHAIAHSGDVSAMRAAFARLPPEYVVLGWDVRGYDPVEGGDTEMLDLAILSGSAAMAKMVQDPEVHEGDLQLGCIHMHKDPQQIRKAVRHGQVARFRAYHKVKPPDAATMAALLVEACETEQLQMAFELWTLGGDSVQEALGTEAKEKLAELGGRAAALGHVDYLQLLVDAGVPLDHCMEGSRSMIIRAASAGRTQAVELLATARADLTTALPEAIGCGHGAAAEALLRRRADPHETWGDEPWESVVGQAIMTNRPEMLRLLADHGAESYTQEHLVFAEEEQAAECLELMRSHRAKGTQLEDQ